jgi:hypothetical protein
MGAANVWSNPSAQSLLQGEKAMSQETYHQLIDDICRLCNIPNAESMYGACQLKVYGVPVTLMLDGPEEGERVIAFCDYGKPSESDETEVLRNALMANMTLLGHNMPHFVVNPETGHLLLVHQQPLKDLTAKGLLGTLELHAQNSNAWQKMPLVETLLREMNAAMFPSNERASQEPS